MTKPKEELIDFDHCMFSRVLLHRSVRDILRGAVAGTGTKPANIAKRLGCSEKDITDRLNGIEEITLEWASDMALALGLELKFELRPNQ